MLKACHVHAEVCVNEATTPKAAGIRNTQRMIFTSPRQPAPAHQAIVTAWLLSHKARITNCTQHNWVAVKELELITVLGKPDYLLYIPIMVT